MTTEPTPLRRLRMSLNLSISLLLISTAALKAYHLAYDERAALGTIRSPAAYVVLVVFEFMLGVWLTTGLYSKFTRAVLMCTFIGFSQASLWLVLSGGKSCGCLGPIAMSPWYSIAFDLAVLIALSVARADCPQKTIRTHPAALLGFIVAILAFGTPGFLTMTMYRKDASRGYSYTLRHDHFLHRAQVSVELRQPTASALMATAAQQLSVPLIVEDSLTGHLATCQPNWKMINHRTHRAWAVLEELSKHTAVPSRWIKTSNGYQLVGDDPLGRTAGYWVAGSAIGFTGLISLVWTTKQCRSHVSHSR